MLHSPAHPSADDADQLLSVTTVRAPRPGRVIVEVVGEVDAYTAPALDACLQSQAIQPGVRELVVQLGQVTFLAAAGVKVLAEADRRCRMRGARLVIRIEGRRSVLRSLQLGGLTALVADVPGAAELEQPGRRRSDPRSARRRAARRHERGRAQRTTTADIRVG